MSQPPHETDAPELPYDPELPFLAALEDDVRRSALRAARRRAEAHALRTQARAGHGPRGARRPGLHPVGTRVARRSLTLVALLCLIGASAFGAREVLSGDGSANPTSVSQGPFVLVAHGRTGSDRWSLRLYTRNGDLCRALTVTEVVASRCAPAPGARTLGVTSVVSPQWRYVFGVSGAAVTRIAVSTGGVTHMLATHTPGAQRARAAGLPVGARYFLDILARPLGRTDPPALVRPLNGQGRPLGPARLSCVETAQPSACPAS